MRVVSSFVLVCGAAAALPAFADPAPVSAGRVTDLRVERESADAAPTPRGAVGSAFATMREELENFPTGVNLGGFGVSAPPTSFTGPPGFQWPMNNLRGQAHQSSGNIWCVLVDLNDAPVGGVNGVVNASKALRVQTAAAQAPGGFYTGANLRFGSPDGDYLATLVPTADHVARVSAEYFISTIAQTFTFETVSAVSGSVTGRLLWGGVCEEDTPGDCTDIGLPIGLISGIFRLGDPCDWGVCAFTPARYCVADPLGAPVPGCVPPPGHAVGDAVTPPIANWSRYVCETTSDGRLRFYLDFLDGAGEFLIVDQRIFTTGLMDRFAMNTSFEAQGAFALVDNIEASGPLYAPFALPPLECPYFDDVDWLYSGPLSTQSTRWSVDGSLNTTVVEDAPRGRVIHQISYAALSDHRYQRELTTLLPPSSATLGNDLVATVEVRTTGGSVRGFALFAAEQPVARVLFGRTEVGVAFEPGVYAQINPGFDPIDEPFGGNPADNTPAVGVDVAATNYDWGVEEYRTLKLRVSANGALRVAIDGQRIYAGAGAFLREIDRFVFESEHTVAGSSATVHINDVTLTCDAPSCAADFDFDDAVTFSDLNAVLAAFGSTGLPASVLNPGDANADGAVDFADLNAVLAAFGTSCD